MKSSSNPIDNLDFFITLLIEIVFPHRVQTWTWKKALPIRKLSSIGFIDFVKCWIIHYYSKSGDQSSNLLSHQQETSNTTFATFPTKIAGSPNKRRDTYQIPILTLLIMTWEGLEPSTAAVSRRSGALPIELPSTQVKVSETSMNIQHLALSLSKRTRIASLEVLTGFEPVTNPPAALSAELQDTQGFTKGMRTSSSFTQSDQTNYKLDSTSSRTSFTTGNRRLCSPLSSVVSLKYDTTNTLFISSSGCCL